MDDRTAGPECDHESRHEFRECLDAAAGSLLEHLRFVIVHCDVFRHAHELEQLFAAEHRQSLPGIEDERDPGIVELLRVLEHAVAAVGRNDPELRVHCLGDEVFMRVIHRAGVKCSDLVVVQIGRDESLRRVAPRHLADVALRNAQLLEPLRVRSVIVTDGRHDERLAAEHPETVSNVPSAAAELAPQVRHEKGNVQDVKLVREDVVLEAVAEHHDGVVRDRAADESRHTSHDAPFGRKKKLMRLWPLNEENTR
jgi:hypothetical protein